VCHSCGRPLCLTCAIPVRGEVFGSECLAEVLGPEWAGPPRGVPVRRPNAPFDLTGAAFFAAVVSTVLPWTRFGAASGLFGAWGISPFQWSTFSALGATAGLLLWLCLRVAGRSGGRSGGCVLLALAVVAASGSILHAYNPPPFTHPWLGPWVALGSAAVAAGASAWLLGRSVVGARAETA
jgi:hypothetical protein